MIPTPKQMQIKFYYKNCEISNDAKDHIIDKIEKFNKYKVFREGVSDKIYVRIQKDEKHVHDEHEFKISIEFFIKDKHFVITKKHPNIFDAMDECEEVITREILQVKEEFIDKKKNIKDFTEICEKVECDICEECRGGEVEF